MSCINFQIVRYIKKHGTSPPGFPMAVRVDMSEREQEADYAKRLALANSLAMSLDQEEQNKK